MYKRYGFLGGLRLVISLVYTKLIYPQARIIRLPFDIRNSKAVAIGKAFTTGFGCRIEALPINKDILTCIKIGQNVQINDYVHIAGGESIIIGDDVLIASKVFITDLNHGNYKGSDQDSPDIPPNDRALSTSPVVIKNKVWIGEGVCIMPGVTIGIGCVIGALSVVTKDIPDYSIAVGVPAKVVKSYDFETKTWVKSHH